MEIQFVALPKLEDLILQISLLIHDVKVGFLRGSGLNLKEELVIDESFNGVFEVIWSEIGVNEGIIQDLAPEKVINLQWGLACDIWGHSYRVIGIWGRILTFPELDLEIFHLIAVEISEDVILGVVDQA